MITHCDICGRKLVTAKKLKFRYILGMADNYVQHVEMCPHCRLIVTGNPFSEEQLNNRYKNFSKFEFDANDYVFDVSDEYKKRSLRQKHFIEENVPDFTSILEIGASSGYNLSLYPNKKTFGIEPSKLNCESARKNYNISMFCGVFEEYYRKQIDQSKREKHDIIFLSHTLEHIVNPCSFLKQCVEISEPEFFFIEVPSFDLKFVNEPYGMFCEEHVNYFTLESLESMMNTIGFILINAEINIEPSSRLAAGFPSTTSIWKKSSAPLKHRYLNSARQILKTYDNASLSELNRIRKIIHSIRSKKLAVWGTGHHVSMLLANTSLSKKNIIKFYDSDTKKHGLKIAEKTIQAFDARDIVNGDIDTVLIATYVAQPQLLKILEPYKDKCRIVTLYDC